MSFKKYLGVIFVFVIVIFVLMLSSSYAWYSFTNGSTSFKTKTDNDLIDVAYKSGKYINTSTGLPVNCDEIDDSSDVGRSDFSVDVNGDAKKRDVVVGVSLIDISIDKELVDSNFKYELLYNGHIIAKGDFATFTGDELNIDDNILLDGSSNNNFELRVYLLDNGENQNYMMNKTFRGTISVNVISRDDSASDFKISSIKIDGKKSSSIPTSGDYSMTSSSCGSAISWDNDTKTIRVNGNGGKIPSSCDVNFVSRSKAKVKFSDVAKVGDYVSYNNNGGVDSCYNGDRKFYGKGYRVAYVDNGSVYLISNGASLCVATDGNNKVSSSLASSGGNVSNHNTNSLKKVIDEDCDSKYVYGGKCDNGSIRLFNVSDFAKISGKSLGNNSCFKSSSDKLCGYSNDLLDNGGYYWIFGNNGNKLFYWDPVMRYVSDNSVEYPYGLRAIIRLDSSVYVKSGSGSASDLYKLGV